MAIRDYRKRDERHVCAECGKYNEDMVWRYNKLLCRRCLPKVVKRVTTANDRDLEYRMVLRASYGLAAE